MQNHKNIHSDSMPSSLASLSIGDVSFSYADLEVIAREVGLIRRKPRTVDPIMLFFELIEQCPCGSPSYNDLAGGMDNAQGHNPSRQAVALRFNDAFVSFLDKLLSQVILAKIQEQRAANILAEPSWRDYIRVIVQDSTVIKLPAALFEHFSGVSNGAFSACNARIQAIYDLMNGRLISFSIDAYSINDLTAAPELELKKGDLVLRDRGYLISDEMQRHIDMEADFIYRHKTHAIYLGPITLLPIDLAALLKKKQTCDMPVLLNNKSKTRVRLVAAPVKKEIADLRRMRAKKETRGHNPSAAVLVLMGWTIFLTNIPAEQATFKNLLHLYGLRWRIEIIFKAWKSHLKFDKLHQVSLLQLQIILKTRLLLLAATAALYKPIERALWQQHSKRLSLLKFMKYLIRKIPNLVLALEWLNNPQSTAAEAFLRKIAKYCSYDKRKKRSNFNEIWESLA